jgi:hypothetical protein
MGQRPAFLVLAKGQLYEAGEFLQVNEYAHVLRWADEIAKRPAAMKGREDDSVYFWLTEPMKEYTSNMSRGIWPSSTRLVRRWL